ncbi:hypothetical protein BS78_06G206200 [Paspalum vaginatum]|nr:hypothetical protein BS78_06G206200 [Paspalum vaginatum]
MLAIKISGLLRTCWKMPRIFTDRPCSRTRAPEASTSIHNTKDPIRGSKETWPRSQPVILIRLYRPLESSVLSPSCSASSLKPGVQRRAVCSSSSHQFHASLALSPCRLASQ